MPLGESRFDVCKRIYDSFDYLHRDNEKHNIEDVIIVTHGITFRAFVMMWLNLTPEWFEKEPNPDNCAVRFLEDQEDRGYIFRGFQEKKNASQIKKTILTSSNMKDFEDKAISQDIQE